MGSQKGNREYNRKNKQLYRRDETGFDDGGGWKRPKAPKRSRRNDDRQAIEDSFREGLEE